MEICVAAFPVAGCGSIKTDLLCWVSLCLGNWLLEVNISVFLFQWVGFIDLLSGQQRALRALRNPHGTSATPPMAQDPISAPSAISPCSSEMPKPCPAMGTGEPGLPYPCQPLLLAFVTYFGCPQLPQPAPLPHEGAETGPGWCCSAVLLC